MTAQPDLLFWFDPVCPFAWLTSQWVREVARQRDYRVQWRFISLRLLNAHLDYASHFPPEYEAGHTAGLRLLRVAARARQEYGHDAVDRFYAASGVRIWESASTSFGGQAALPDQLQRGLVEELLAEARLPGDLTAALDDDRWDVLVQAETDEALALTGRDVGTPILQFRPPEGLAFFGPVISRLPDPEQAVALWDHVVGLAGFAGFAELKRSLRERPQLAALGVPRDEIGVQDDWQAGRRRPAT